MPVLTVPNVLLITKVILENLSGLAALVPGGIEVGPMEPESETLGCIEIVDAPKLTEQAYVSLEHRRVQLNCYSEGEDATDAIAAKVGELHHRGRQVVNVGGGLSYLVHWTKVTGGPVAGVTRNQTARQEVVFVEMLIGTVPIP